MQLFQVKLMVHLAFIFVFTISVSVTGHGVDSHPNWNLIDKENCGKPSTNSRIIGGREAELGQYPWLALLGYNDQHGKHLEYLCGGALINPRYVLTAGHCIDNIDPPFELVVVKLGEHDVNSDPDCRTTDCVGKKCKTYCADPVQDYLPEKLIPHEDFDNPEFQNDIGLIRLDRSVRMTDWIKPICLPFGKIMSKNFVGRIAEVSGWGSTFSDGEDSSDVLFKLKVRVVENMKCRQTLEYRLLSISDKHICAGGVENEDTCNGDSGVPLMMLDGRDLGVRTPRYFALGILSVGATDCGAKDVPAVYIRVSEYISWILNNIRP